MGRRRREPDFALVLAVLTQAERAMIAGWLGELGAPPGSWHRIPPFRLLLPLIAALRLAGAMPNLCRADALAEGFSALGLGDDTDRATRPSDSFARTLSRWLGAAHGQNVRPSKAAAA